MIASRHCQQIVRYHSDSVGCRHDAQLQTSHMLAWQAWSLRQSHQFGDARNTIGRSGPQKQCNTCTALLNGSVSRVQAYSLVRISTHLCEYAMIQQSR